MIKLLSEHLVDYLEHKNVEYVFGLCGHTVIAMLDALKDRKVKYISTRHEQVAATMADGYARITKRASVCMTHLGPGLTNATTGVANAAMDNIPMIVIAGDVPSFYYGKHPHQEVNLHADADQFSIFKPFVKRAFRLERPELLPDIMERAFVIAESGRPGPVLVSIPMDMFSREMDSSHWERAYIGENVIDSPDLSEETAMRIAKALLEAKRPLLHIGGQTAYTEATDEIKELIEFIDLPVTRTLMGQGVISDKHPLMVGMTGFWGTEFVNGMTKNADLILAFGTRFAEADSSSWYQGVTFSIPDTKLIQIDLEPSEVGRNYPIQIGAQANPKKAAKKILAALKELLPEGMKREDIKAEIKSYKDTFKESNKAIEDDDRFPMTPQRILRDVRSVFPDDGIIFTDVGWNKNGVGQQFDITKPNTIHHPGGLATMGFGSLALLGAKLAAPDKKVITLVGDGGFGTNPTALATAVEYNIPAIWVIMNNSAFGTIAGLESSHYHHTFGTVFKDYKGDSYSPEWAEIAKGYGVKAKKVTSAKEFKEIFKEALESNEPYVIDVPMENIPVPTEGIWNINDIYTPKDNVVEGKLQDGEAIKSVHATTN